MNLGRECKSSTQPVPVLDYSPSSGSDEHLVLYAVAIPVAVLMTVLMLASAVMFIPPGRLPLATVPIVRSPVREVVMLLPLVFGGPLACTAGYLQGSARYHTHAVGIWTGLVMSALAVGTLVISVLGFVARNGGQ